jgi:hypothetical protein
VVDQANMCVQVCKAADCLSVQLIRCTADDACEPKSGRKELASAVLKLMLHVGLFGRQACSAASPIKAMRCSPERYHDCLS